MEKTSKSKEAAQSIYKELTDEEMQAIMREIIQVVVLVVVEAVVLPLPILCSSTRLSCAKSYRW